MNRNTKIECNLLHTHGETFLFSSFLHFFLIFHFFIFFFSK